MENNHGVYLKLPGVNEPALREAFHQATDVRTLAIYCPDPRAYGIPSAIAHEFDLRCPGESIRDETGAKAAFDTNLALAVTVGGRAVDALRTITSLSHLLRLGNVVVVHHTFCGLTAFTVQGLINAYKHEQGLDLSRVYRLEDLSIDNLEESVRYDVTLIRNAPGTPNHINIFGYIYDINAESLTRIVEDRGIEN